MRCNIKLDFIYIYQGHRNRLCNTKTKLIMSKSPKYDLSAAISIYYPHIISQHLNVKQEREFRRQILCVCGEGGNAFVPPSILWLRWTITLCQKSARGCTLTPCKYSINIKLRKTKGYFCPQISLLSVFGAKLGFIICSWRLSEGVGPTT